MGIWKSFVTHIKHKKNIMNCVFSPLGHLVGFEPNGDYVKQVLLVVSFEKMQKTELEDGHCEHFLTSKEKVSW